MKKNLVSICTIIVAVVVAASVYAATTATRAVRSTATLNHTNALALATSRGAETVAVNIFNGGSGSITVGMASSVTAGKGWVIVGGGSLSFPNSTVDAVPAILYGISDSATLNAVVTEQWIR